MQSQTIHENCKGCEIAPCFSLTCFTGKFWRNQEQSAKLSLALEDRICPDCSSPLDEDWAEDIDEDGELFEFEVLKCSKAKCGFQTPI